MDKRKRRPDVLVAALSSWPFSGPERWQRWWSSPCSHTVSRPETSDSTGTMPS